MRVKCVDLSEWIEEGLDFHRLLLVGREKSQELVMLRSELEDFTHPDDYMLEVLVQVGRALPLMLQPAPPPQHPGQMRHAFLPPGAYSHALIELQSHIREGGLPHITFLEFSLDSGAEGLGDDAEGVLHSLLRIVGMDTGVAPDVSQSLVDAIYVAGDGTQRGFRQILEVFANWSEVRGDELCIFSHRLVRLSQFLQSLALELLPNVKLVKRVENASERLWVEVKLPEIGTALSSSPVEASSERVQKISQLVIPLISGVLVSAPEEWHVDLGDESIQRADWASSHRRDEHLGLDLGGVDVFVVKFYKVYLGRAGRWLSNHAGNAFDRLAIRNYLQRLHGEVVEEHSDLRGGCDLGGQLGSTKRVGCRVGQVLGSGIV